MSNKKRQAIVAYHEAGHAIMGCMTPGYDPVAKVTILPRSNGAGGFTLFTPSQDRMDGGMYSLRYLKAQLQVALGGRCAEEVIYGPDEVTTGASNDLMQVRSIARRMVTQWGFAGDNIGMTAWEEDGGGMGRSAMSEEKEEAIDAEVKKLVDEAYAATMKLLGDNRPLLEEVTNGLLEKETIDGFELNDMVLKLTGKPPATAFGVVGEPEHQQIDGKVKEPVV
jgi:cell division protease FtsH